MIRTSWAPGLDCSHQQTSDRVVTEREDLTAAEGERRSVLSDSVVCNPEFATAANDFAVSVLRLLSK